MSFTTERALRLAAEMLEAIQAGRLYLGFQPVVRLADQHILGVEALLRWDHPTYGVLRPAEFLEFTSGRWSELALRTTDFVLDSALQLAAECREWNLPVSVNVTAWDLGDSSLAHRVKTALEKHSIPPDRLTLEILETDALHPDAADALSGVRSAGVRLAIDDVGVGLSNLDRILAIPEATLKVDRLLVAKLPASAPVLTSVLRMARESTPPRHVIAEGVRDMESRSELMDLGFESGQGFAWGEPDQTRAADVVSHFRSDWVRVPGDDLP